MCVCVCASHKFHTAPGPLCLHEGLGVLCDKMERKQGAKHPTGAKYDTADVEHFVFKKTPILLPVISAI